MAQRTRDRAVPLQFLGGEDPSQVTEEAGQFSPSNWFVLSDGHESHELLAQQVAKGLLQAEALTDGPGGIALVQPPRSFRCLVAVTGVRWGGVTIHEVSVGKAIESGLEPLSADRARGEIGDQ